MTSQLGSVVKFEEIEQDIDSGNFAQAESALKPILERQNETDSELREHEKALTTLGSLYKRQK